MATIALDVFDNMTTVFYRACFDRGHIDVEQGSRAASTKLRLDPDRDRTATDSAVAGWRIGESHDLDGSQSLTIDSRLRDEQPQLWARAEGIVPTYVATSGLERTALETVLRKLRDPASTHRVGTLHLHLPAEAVFDSIGFQSSEPDATVPRYPSEMYSARFTRKTQWVQQGPIETFAGVPFWSAPYAQPTDDHVGIPTIPAWHGEATIGSLVLEIHATGTAVTPERYRTFAERVIRAAMTTPNAACRERSGHMGTL